MASGNGAAVFTVDLLIFHSYNCDLTAPLRHVAGFPDLGLLRELCPVLQPTADHEPVRRRPGWPEGRTATGPFPRSPLTDRRVRRPAFPLQHRHRYAAGLPHDLPTVPVQRLRSRPRTGVRCGPAHIHQVGAGSGLEGVQPLVSALVHLPVLLAGPGPSGSTGPSRRCRGCSHPHLRPQAQAAPSFNEPLRRPAGEVLSSSLGQNGASWRTTGLQYSYYLHGATGRLTGTGKGVGGAGLVAHASGGQRATDPATR